MPNQSDNRKKRRSNVIPLVTPGIEQTTGDPLFEQPLIEDANDSVVESSGPSVGRSGARKGGKARAKKLGKAKLSAIAKKVTRSRWKKAR